MSDRMNHLDEGAVHAWLDGGDVLRDLYEVQCPIHKSRFSFKTGEPTGLPATEPVPAYAVRIDGADILVGPKEQ